MVPGAGLEPARCYQRGILNPLCLPISPPGHGLHNCAGAGWLPLKNGGGTRSRTEIHGFAIRCIAILPFRQFGAGNEIRTRDPDLGKVVLYQLSYSRIIAFLPLIKSVSPKLAKLGNHFVTRYMLYQLSYYRMSISAAVSVRCCSLKRGVHSTCTDKTVNSKNHQNTPKYLICCLFAFFLFVLHNNQPTLMAYDVRRDASRPRRCTQAWTRQTKLPLYKAKYAPVLPSKWGSP